MTTIAAPQERTPRVLRAGVLGVLAGTAVLTGVALVAADAAAVRSALLGGGLVVVFFAFGAVNVSVAARIAPATAMLVALVTYTMQVVLVLLAFVALRRSDAFEETLVEGWLAAGLIVGTLVWMTAQVVTTLRTPIPPWEPADRAQEVGAA